MAATLDWTIGGVSSNSYVSLDYANAYFDNHLYAETWAEQDDDTKAKALIMATRFIDDYANWIGWQQTAAQILGWPRSGAIDRAGHYIPINSIPRALKNAVCEYAQSLISSAAMPGTTGSIATGGDIPAGMKSLEVGSIAVEFDTSVAQPSSEIVPSTVWSMINYLLVSRAVGATIVPLVRR